VSATIRHLVVYGTLRSDAPVTLLDRPDLTGRVRSLGSVRIAGHLHDAGGYPVLVRTSGGARPESVDVPRPVVAELLELLDAEVLARIDDYEELGESGPDGAEYARVIIHVPEHGVDAWLYCAGRDATHLPRIASGDWLRR
jgi:gamma-glutamylcyclotransferase (GGCT)/AIG2-like uncharacterized protein YtfP